MIRTVSAQADKRIMSFLFLLLHLLHNSRATAIVGGDEVTPHSLPFIVSIQVTFPIGQNTLLLVWETRLLFACYSLLKKTLVPESKTA